MSENISFDLTERQEQVLNFIRASIKRGFPPTRAEIAQHFKFKSANAAQDHIKALERKGRIALLPGLSRGIKVLAP